MFKPYCSKWMRFSSPSFSQKTTIKYSCQNYDPGMSFSRTWKVQEYESVLERLKPCLNPNKGRGIPKQTWEPMSFKVHRS